MSTITFHAPFTPKGDPLADLEVISADWSLLRYAGQGGWEAAVGGSFYVEDEALQGDVTSLSYIWRDRPIMVIDDFSIGWNDFTAYALFDGNDTVQGHDGADLAHAQGGDDILRGAGGADRLYGDSGHDRLLGEDGADRLYGDDGRDRLFGGGDKDRLSGGSGHDLLDAGDGADRLLGGSGNDTLRGGRGDDQLTGGTGQDVLRGDAGADSFVFETAGDSPDGGHRDSIGDFTSGSDRIVLTDLYGSDDFAFIGGRGFSGHAGEWRYAKGILAGDLDGDGRADLEIALADSPRLTGHDLVF